MEYTSSRRRRDRLGRMELAELAALLEARTGMHDIAVADGIVFGGATLTTAHTLVVNVDPAGPLDRALAMQLCDRVAGFLALSSEELAGILDEVADDAFDVGVAGSEWMLRAIAVLPDDLLLDCRVRSGEVETAVRAALDQDFAVLAVTVDDVGSGAVPPIDVVEHGSLDALLGDLSGLPRDP